MTDPAPPACRPFCRPPGDCPGCSALLARATAELRQRHGMAAPPAARPNAANRGPCRFRGAELSGPERQAANLGHARTWTHCLHESQPLGPAVCSCRGCGVRCPGYTPDGPAESSALSLPVVAAGDTRPGDPAAGVVVGHYEWPALVELQLRLIRRACGPVPVLVSSDDPPAADRLAAICAAHPDVTLEVSPERIGHTGGDLAALWRGLRWAKARGLVALAKVSQRFLATRPRWVQDGAAELLASGLPLAARRCRGKENFPLRTEAMVLDVAAWGRPEVLSQLVPRRYWTDRPTGRNAEMVVHETLSLLGGVYWPWSLITEDRYARSPGVVWHGSHTRAEYERLAAALGGELDAGFHTAGWQKERDRGEYLYG